MTIGEELQEPRRTKSLFEKYDVPVHHLEFDYLKNCSNVKELEKIVKILRSRQEGHYPELLDCAETQLRSVDANNRLLRTESTALKRSSLTKPEWADLEAEIGKWIKDIGNKDSALSEASAAPVLNFLPKPEIRRQPAEKRMEATQKKTQAPPRISSSDYKSWEKYDADEECLKMDLVEEKAKEEEMKKEVEMKAQEKLSLEELAIKSLEGTLENLSQHERELMAVQEKDRGNEFYKAQRLDQAIRHYTRSIFINPTSAGFNNRAATYLKQCKFSKALDDLNEVIRREPTNVKAYYRRALCFQHQNEFHMALDDISVVLEKEPNHIIARHVADQLRDNCATLPKKHHLVVHDKENGETKLVTVTEEEMLRDYRDKDFIEVNERGLPKIMCNCNGKYSDDPGIQHDDRIRLQHLHPEPNSCTIPNGRRHYRKTSRKIEVVELEKINEEEEAKSGKCVVSDKRSHSARAEVKTESNEIPTIKEEPGEYSEAEMFHNHVEDPPVQAKDVKTSTNITIQESSCLTNGYDDLIDLSARCDPGPLKPCGCAQDYSTYQFKEKWRSLKMENNPVSRMSHLLRTICPKHLPQAFGNSWDKPLLEDLLKCLRYHFNPETEQELIGNYLRAISSFERFKIIYLFLDPKEVKMAKELLEVGSASDPTLKEAFAF